MAIKAEEVLKSLKSGQFEPVYFLQGEEPFFIDEISNYIEDNAIDESQKSFNLIVFYGKEVDMAQILTNARRFPMMSDRQVVIVKEAQEHAGFKNEAGRALLEEYLDNPVPSTILVFCHKYKKLDGRSALAKNVKDKSVFVNTEPIRDYQLPAWIENYIRTKGMAISGTAAQLMADHIGTKLERIVRELDKIQNNIEEGVEIGIEHVQKYVGINKDYNVFELGRALQKKDRVRVNKIVAYFDQNSKSQSVIPLIAYIYSMFSKLLRIHFSKANSDSALAKTLGVSPFMLKEYRMGQQNYSRTQVLSGILAINQADLLVKGVERPSISDGQILKDLVQKLMSNA